MLLLEELDVFFTVDSVIRAAPLSVHADGVVEGTSVAMALAVALDWSVSASMRGGLCGSSP